MSLGLWPLASSLVGNIIRAPCLTGLKLRHGSYSAEFKLSVLKHMHQNHLSLLETAVHFGIPGPFVIRQWERLYQNQGAEGLRRKPQRRSRP